MRRCRAVLCYHWDTLITRPTAGVLEERNPQQRLQYQLHWAKTRKEVRKLVEDAAETGKIGVSFARDTNAGDWGMVLEKLSQTNGGGTAAARQQEVALLNDVAWRLRRAIEAGDVLRNPAPALLGLGRLVNELRDYEAIAPPPSAAPKLLLGESGGRGRAAGQKVVSAVTPEDWSRRHAALVDHLLLAAVGNRDNLHAHEVTAALQGAHLARVRPSAGATLSLLRRAVEPDCITQVVAVDVAYLLRAAEYLPHQDDAVRAELAGIIEALGVHVVTRLATTFTPAQLASSLRSLATLGLPHEGMVQVLAERMLAPHVLDSLSGEEAAVAIHALGVLGGVGDLRLERVPIDRLATYNTNQQRLTELNRLQDEIAVLPVTGDIMMLPKLSDKRAAHRNDAWSPKHNWTAAGEDAACVWTVQRLAAHSVLRKVMAARRPMGAPHCAMLLNGCAALGYHHPERTWALEQLLMAKVAEENARGGAQLLSSPTDAPAPRANPLLGRGMATDPLLAPGAAQEQQLPDGFAQPAGALESSWSQVYFEYRTYIEGTAGGAAALPEARQYLLDGLSEAANVAEGSVLLLTDTAAGDERAPREVWTDGWLRVVPAAGEARRPTSPLKTSSTDLRDAGGHEVVVKPAAPGRRVRGPVGGDPRKMLRRRWGAAAAAAAKENTPEDTVTDATQQLPTSTADPASYAVVPPANAFETAISDTFRAALANKGVLVDMHRDVMISAGPASAYRLGVAAFYVLDNGTPPVALVVPEAHARKFDIVDQREDAAETGTSAVRGPDQRHVQLLQHMVGEGVQVVTAPRADLVGLDDDERAAAVQAVVDGLNLMRPAAAALAVPEAADGAMAFGSAESDLFAEMDGAVEHGSAPSAPPPPRRGGGGVKTAKKRKKKKEPRIVDI